MSSPGLLARCAVPSRVAVYAVGTLQRALITSFASSGDRSKMSSSLTASREAVPTVGRRSTTSIDAVTV